MCMGKMKTAKGFFLSTNLRASAHVLYILKCKGRVLI